jgi:Zn-dependent membrane protease YugP
MFFFDPMYFVFALPALLLAFYAQAKVQSAFNKYSQMPNRRNLTGQEAARYLLSAGQLSVSVEGSQGQLSDHYDPRAKILRLSPQVAMQSSVAALGVVAHEVGHALQDNDGYVPLRLRSGLVPVVNLGSWLGPIIFFIGLFFAPRTNLAWVGVILFALSAVFALVTLPVELDASRRAMQLLTNTGLVAGEEERKGVSSVLNAAALTYVAAVAQALSTLLYYVFIVTGFGRRRD